MTLTDPQAALAEQNTVATALTGLAGLARLVHALAAADRVADRVADPADDLVHLLLGIARLGDGVPRLAGSAPPEPGSAPAADAPPREWLR